jgi:hypothetical protein
MAKLPTDPITPLQVRCVAMHEHYEALIAAGFTPREAMDYLIGITKGTR